MIVKKEYLSHIDLISDNIIYGWCFNSTENKNVEIDLYLNNKKLLTEKANGWREDLANIFQLDCLFAITLPKSIELKLGDIISLTISGTNESLKNFPINISKPVIFYTEFFREEYITSGSRLLEVIGLEKDISESINNSPNELVLFLTNSSKIITVEDHENKQLKILYCSEDRFNEVSQYANFKYIVDDHLIKNIFNYILFNPHKYIYIDTLDFVTITLALGYRLIWGSEISLDKSFGSSLLEMLNDKFHPIRVALISRFGRYFFHALNIFLDSNDEFIRTLRAIYLLSIEKTQLTENDEKIIDTFDFDLIAISGYFDSDWYASRYEFKGRPLAHYLRLGASMQYDPSPHFSTSYYLKANQDVLNAGINPLLHFVLSGKKEGRRFFKKAFQSNYHPLPINYVSRLPLNDSESFARQVRVIAFYLPQFHEIAENNRWWGDGFTEWTNVKPSKPLFKNHYQPHTPDDSLGYYDLLNTSIQKKQIDLAKQYGIGGFCFYLYWFGGHKLLEQPLENYLNDSQLDMPFCICWANENWTRRWDGNDQDILMAQDYSPEDDIAFIANASRYLRDSRYIKVNGKPLLMVYRPSLFPDIKATVFRWRNWCRENQLGEIYLVYPQSFDCVDPAEYGFDAATEFPPNNSSPPDITDSIKNKIKNFDGMVFDWRIFLERSDCYTPTNYTLFRGICPSWDNTARKKNKGTVFLNSCPKLFEQWVTNAFSDTLMHAKSDDERIVFVNAWNEWAEGCHLEPDQRYGFAWLDAIRKAHFSLNTLRPKIVLVTHDAHPHGAQLLVLHLAKSLNVFFKFTIHIICLGEGILINEYKKYAFVHEVNCDLDNNSTAISILDHLKKDGCNVAIVNTTVSGKLVPYLYKAGYRIITLVHELPEILKSYQLKEPARNIVNYSERVVFAADVVRNGFLNFTEEKISDRFLIRPQGLYLPSLMRAGCNKEFIRSQVLNKHGLAHDTKLIMCAGFGDKRKGFDLFVQICSMVMQEIPQTRAIWVGHLDHQFVDGILASVDIITRSKFIFTGRVESPQEYYLAADIYALTSREDPFPSVVMEALDALTPVIAFSGCGGFEELLRRDCGVLVPFGNIKKFTEEIVSLIQDTDRSKKLASKGQEIVAKEFSFNGYIYDILEYAGQPLRRVSVVIPNYNYSNYIIDRIKNILNQTYPVYEIIILDDASTDNSVELIQEFLYTLDLPHVFIVNKKNSGSVFAQWHRGVSIAQGDLVWIAEVDDLAEPDFLATLVETFLDEEVKLAYSQSKQIDENGQILAPDYLAYTKDIGEYWNESYCIEGELEIKRALFIKNTIPNVSGAIFEKDALMQVLSENLNEIMKYKVAGDWYLYLKLLMKGKIAFKSRSLNLHRRHSSSVTKLNNHLNEIVAIHNFLIKELPLNKKNKDKILSYQKFLQNYFENS